MKKILFTLISMIACFATASAQSMKVYQNGQLKAIYYVSKDDKIEFSDDFPFPEDKGDNTNENENTNVHEYVDLGLSVKWATMNIGATSPEDYGDYFAWGETQPKESYTKDTYFDPNHSKYDANKPSLDMEDDAAYVNWGGNWRMPTSAELEELHTNCTWTWTTQNGVNGCKVTSKANGNSIFLPAAGYCYNSNVKWQDNYGYYWSSTPCDGQFMYVLYFLSGSQKVYEGVSRPTGCPVRAVFVDTPHENDDDETIDASNYPTAIVGTWMEDGRPSEESVTWVFNANGTGSYCEDGYEDSFRYHFTEGRNFVLNIWGTSLHCIVQKLTKNECYFYIEEEEKGPNLKRKK